MDGGVSQLLEFVNKTSGKNDSEVIKIIKEALEDEKVYVFAELLHCEAVEKIQSSPKNEKIINTLKLFSTGTYLQYKNDPSEFISLTDKMKKKLKLLSIISLCNQLTVCFYLFIVVYFLFYICEQLQSVPYSLLQSETDCCDVSEVESLIIEGIYKNIFRGKFDRRKECFQLELSAPRDTEDNDISDMIDILEGWQKQLNLLDTSLLNQKNELDNEASKEATKFDRIGTREQYRSSSSKEVTGEDFDDYP